MNGTWKIGTTSVGAAATLLAGILSLGGGSDPGGEQARSVERTSGAGRDLVGMPAEGVAAVVARDDGMPAAALVAETAASPPADTPVAATVTSVARAAGDVREDRPESLSVTIPRRVTVVLPRYEGGRSTEVTPPEYTPGTTPSIETKGNQVIIDLGEPGTLTPPSVRRGEPGTFTPPEVIVE